MTDVTFDGEPVEITLAHDAAGPDGLIPGRPTPSGVPISAEEA